MEKIEKQTKGIVPVFVDAILMENGEIMCLGKCIGMFDDLKGFVLAKKEEKSKLPYKKITVPMSDQDCHDIINGETFDWTFDEVDVHIKLEDQDDLE